MPALLALLCTTGVGSAGEVAVYLCRVGEPAQRLETVPAAPSAEEMERTRQQASLAVGHIARAVRADGLVTDAWPLFLELLRQGPGAGTAEGAQAPPADPSVEERGRRFMDAAARLGAAPPAGLLREWLADESLVATLREGDSTSDRASTEAVQAWLEGRPDPARTALGLLPARILARDYLEDPALVERALEALNEGLVTGDVAQLLARTVLWDMRLYLADSRTVQDQAAALEQADDALLEGFLRMVGENHVKHFLLGPRESAGQAEQWEALDAPRFIASHPEHAWVGHAAALAHELRHGTLLRVVGAASPALGAGRTTLPLLYVVEPAAGASYATTHLVWPRGVDGPYEGIRCLADTATQWRPAPITGAPSASALSYEVVFTQPGAGQIMFQYRVYGLDLPPVRHGVEVRPADAGPGEPGETPGLSEPVISELATPPEGYALLPDAGRPPAHVQEGVMDGGRRIIELADPRYALEHRVVYEIRRGRGGGLPAEVTYCDPNPRGNEAVARAAVEDARRIVAEPLKGHFSADMLPSLDRVPGRTCWVGRRGTAPDGAEYYVLCRGTQAYYRRGETLAPVEVWHPVAGEQDVYDAAQIRDETVAWAEAVLEALLARGPGRAPRAETGPQVAPEVVAGFLGEAREVLDADAGLVVRVSEMVTARQERRLDDAGAAGALARDVLPAYEALAARAAALEAPDPALRALRNDLRDILNVGAAAVSLLERSIRGQDPERVTRAVGLLYGHEPKRTDLRARAAALEARYAP